jgi:DNA mismatch repair ATPase MutS
MKYNMAKEIVETPLMKQYFEVKSKHPDAILLFRVGDFYETFAEDAIASSEILGIVLTRRANGTAQFVELAGFPHHALDTYLPKLVRAGKRVAICDQLEDPKLTKKIVKRGITELVTPGVSINDNILNFGGGFAVNAGPIQLYLIADKISSIRVIDMRAVNIQFGMNIVLNRMEKDLRKRSRNYTVRDKTGYVGYRWAY